MRRALDVAKRKRNFSSEWPNDEAGGEENGYVRMMKWVFEI